MIIKIQTNNINILFQVSLSLLIGLMFFYFIFQIINIYILVKKSISKILTFLDVRAEVKEGKIYFLIKIKKFYVTCKIFCCY